MGGLGMSQQEAWGSQPRPLALLGWPVGHSISPAIHNAAFAAEGIPAQYLALAIPPDGLGAAVRGLAGLGFMGANVTVPHKEAVLPLLDEVLPEAARIGAVNVIAVRDGRLVGANTDAAGFLAHLQGAGVDPEGMAVAILGAGGAARAVAYALAQAGVRQLTVLNRRPQRAESVANLAREVAAEAGRELPVQIGPLEGGEIRVLLNEANLVVNCTSVGMGPTEGESPLPEGLGSFSPGAIVYDTIYRPRETRLLQEARQQALVGLSGLGMLVYQAALSWEYWFGRHGPVETMMEAAERALAGAAVSS